MAKRPVTTADVLDGHVSLDIECLDRIYLNGYVPNLQVSGQVVQFLAHCGFPIPSPVVLSRIGDSFRRAASRSLRAGVAALPVSPVTCRSAQLCCHALVSQTWSAPPISDL
jgi:hypothetical protein